MTSKHRYESSLHNSKSTPAGFIARLLSLLKARKSISNTDIERMFANLIMDSSKSMLTIINREYRYEKVNRRFCATHSMDNSLIEGRSLPEIWGEENFKRNIKPSIDRCFNGESVHYEACFETPAGISRHYEVNFRPLATEKGEINLLVAETIDITDIKESERAFRQIEKEFRNLEANLPVGFVRCKPDGEIVYINNACKAIFRLPSPSPSRGEYNLADFYSDRKQFPLHIRKLNELPAQTIGRVSFRALTGEDIVCRLTGFMNKGEGQNDVCVDFALEDITREVYLENRLLQSGKLESVGSLAGGIAHDFNNILTTIYGYAELSVDEVDKESALYESLTRIIAAVNKARSLTSQMLTFSRQVGQEKVPVNVCQVVNETIGFIKAGMPKNIILTEKTTNQCVNVLADPTQLFRVFMNLFTNALQAMEQDGGELKVEVGPVVAKEETTRVEVKVSDTGVGIDETVINRIFEPFYTTRDVGKGTGLGLSVVHGIVSEMGGEIEVQSKKGAGSVFTISLPVLPDEQNLSNIINNGTDILFISQNRHESSVLRHALEKSGYNVTVAESGEECLAKLKKGLPVPDILIFVDEFDGFNLKDLREHLAKEALKPPILVITGSHDLILDESFLNSDFVKHFLLKPVSLREVKHAIEVILTGK